MIWTPNQYTYTRVFYKTITLYAEDLGFFSSLELRSPSGTVYEDMVGQET